MRNKTSRVVARDEESDDDLLFNYPADLEIMLVMKVKTQGKKQACTS